MLFDAAEIDPKPSATYIAVFVFGREARIRFSACGTDTSACVRQCSHYVLQPQIESASLVRETPAPFSCLLSPHLSLSLSFSPIYQVNHTNLRNRVSALF